MNSRAWSSKSLPCDWKHCISRTKAFAQSSDKVKQGKHGEPMQRLLVVDDDESIRKLLRFRLKDLYEITETASAEEALALALQVKPGAILLDLSMPKYSGLELCQALGSLSFTQLIPIFIISGAPAGRYQGFCENLGAKGYFQKPIDFDALRARLAEVLNGSTHDRRAEPRVRLRVSLKLSGNDSEKRVFDLQTVTENVSSSGFCCGCRADLNVDAVVAVALASCGKPQFVGKARVAHVQWPKTPGQQCGFQFLEKPLNWVLM